MCQILKSLHADESGTAFIEYTALLGVVLAVGLVILASVGGWITSVWVDLCTSLKINSCST